MKRVITVSASIKDRCADERGEWNKRGKACENVIERERTTGARRHAQVTMSSHTTGRERRGKKKEKEREREKKASGQRGGPHVARVPKQVT